MTEFEDLTVRYTAGWIGFDGRGLPSVEGAGLMLPDVSIEALASQEVHDRRAAAERAASWEIHQENEAHAARLAGFSATSVEQVLARVRQETAISDRRAERHRALEQLRPEALSEREITERRLRETAAVSRQRGPRAGRRLARIRGILHGDDAVNRARDEQQERRSGQWPMLTRSTGAADFRIGDVR